MFKPAVGAIIKLANQRYTTKRNSSAVPIIDATWAVWGENPRPPSLQSRNANPDPYRDSARLGVQSLT